MSTKVGTYILLCLNRKFGLSTYLCLWSSPSNFSIHTRFMHISSIFFRFLSNDLLNYIWEIPSKNLPKQVSIVSRSDIGQGSSQRHDFVQVIICTSNKTNKSEANKFIYLLLTFYIQNGHKATVQMNETRFAIKHFTIKAHLDRAKYAPHFYKLVHMSENVY